jgi:hypothetical protein
MLVVMFGVAAIVVSAPIVAALIVSAASRREDASWSLGGPARSRLEALARRIVVVQVDSFDWPRSRARQEAEASQRKLMPETIDTTTEAGARTSL